MMDIYNSNKDFKGYVDRYSKKYVEGKSIPVEEALKHEQVRLVAEQYRGEEREVHEQDIANII